MATKRGINLGCGHVILPCEQPQHHALIPGFLYTDPDIQWDNADWNAGGGVSLDVDLFDYPWRTPVSVKPTENDEGVVVDLERVGGLLPDNTYDYAIAAHIAEHIPHHIVENGQFVARHREYQDGWFYWFGELNRILKPGGKAYILCPYAWANSGISDPTHTRYITPASFNYLVPNDESPFEYRGRAGWKPINYHEDFFWTAHQLGVRTVKEDMTVLGAITRYLTHGVVPTDDWLGDGLPEGDDNRTIYHSLMWDNAQTHINTFADILVVLTKVGA